MYKYPDVDDKNLIKNVMTSDWEDSSNLEEKYINESIQLLPPNLRNLLLDAGCGQEGRLFPYFKNNFKIIIAIDPDIARLSKAKETNRNDKNIKYFLSTIENFSYEDKFDFIICSHVIHHMCTYNVKGILQNLYNLMQPHGLLALLTTNWPENEDQFEIRNTLTNHVEIVDEESFNQCVIKNDHHLPTRHFSEKTLRQLINDVNFKIIFLKKYHGYPKIRGDNFILLKKQ